MKAKVSEFPRDCRTLVYTYGNGVLDMVDAPNKCADIVAEFNNVDSDFFPVEYKVRGQKLTFRKKHKILDPELGTLNIFSSGTFNIDQMTLQIVARATSKRQNGSMKMRIFSHCN